MKDIIKVTAYWIIVGLLGFYPSCKEMVVERNTGIIINKYIDDSKPNDIEYNAVILTKKGTKDTFDIGYYHYINSVVDDSITYERINFE